MFAGSGYFYRLDDYPPYLDYDSATLGIFVNNVSFHEDYATGFRHSAVTQDAYRADWAAEFLPASVVLSSVQRAFSIPPDRVGDLLEIVALILGALGTAVVVSVACRCGRATAAEGLFLAGFLTCLPSFFLYLRTTQPHFLFSFFMFWLAVACIDRYLDTGSTRALAVLALTMALYPLLPYVPLVVLPLTGLTMAVARGRVGALLRDARLYAAATLSVTLFAGLQYAVAVTHEPSWQAWMEMSQRFVKERSAEAWPLFGSDGVTFSDKLVKLLHQHFVHRWDPVGERSRVDLLWTMPEPHLVWLLLIPVGLLGAWQAWRRRDAAAGVFAAVLLPTYAVALTVGLPEGRYLLTAVPALAWFTLFGLRTICGGTAALPITLALVLTAATTNTWALVGGEYHRSITHQWRRMAGLREAVEFIHREYGAEYGRSRPLFLHWPELRYSDRLYAQMLGNMRVVPFDTDSNLAQLAPGQPLFAAVEVAEDPGDDMRSWESRGFEEIAEVVDGPTGRRFKILFSPP